MHVRQRRLRFKHLPFDFSLSVFFESIEVIDIYFTVVSPITRHILIHFNSFILVIYNFRMSFSKAKRFEPDKGKSQIFCLFFVWNFSVKLLKSVILSLLHSNYFTFFSLWTSTYCLWSKTSIWDWCHKFSKRRSVSSGFNTKSLTTSSRCNSNKALSFYALSTNFYILNIDNDTITLLIIDRFYWLYSYFQICSGMISFTSVAMGIVLICLIFIGEERSYSL